MDQTLTNLEQALAGTEDDAVAAVTAAARLQSVVKAIQKAAKTGDLRALRKALGDAEDAVGAAAEAVAALTDGWPHPEDAEVEHFASGAFTREVLEEARRSGLSLYEHDGVLACYPSLVRVVPRYQHVTVDRKAHRQVRPSKLVEHLLDRQQRDPRFRAEQFLESLYSAYRLRAADRHGVERLSDIHKVLTILPSAKADYSLQEFARDVYLLDGSGVTQARDGSQMRLHPGATGAKNPGNLLIVVTRDGTEKTYLGIEFIT